MMLRSFLLLTTLLPTLALAADTDWIELEAGDKDESMGAVVKEVQTKEQKIVTVAIPKKAIESKESISEVIVYGKREKTDTGSEEPLLDISYEWVDDFENDNYGLQVKLSKDTNYPIRLHFKATNDIPNH